MALDARRSLVGISGFGSIGRQHARALVRAGCERIVVFEPSPQLRQEAAAADRVVATFDRFDDLIAAGLDALIIAAPDAHHVAQLDAATAARVPTLVEKPVAPSVADIGTLAEIAGRGVAVVVGYVLRHRRLMQAVQAELAGGAIGTPTSFHVMLGSYGTIRAARSRFDEPEPNRLYRDYSHEWDYLRWFFGGVESIFAVARTTQGVPHVERPNLVDGLVRTADGALGAFHLDYVEPRGTRTLHVIGTGGTLFADIASGVAVVRVGEHVDDRTIAREETAADALASQAAHLLDVAHGKVAPIVGIEDGVAALRVTEAALVSARTQSWVAVDPRPIFDEPR